MMATTSFGRNCRTIRLAIECALLACLLLPALMLRAAAQALPPPTGVTATTGDDEVLLTWTAAVGATAYDVLRGTVSNEESPIAVDVSTDFYSDTSAADGATYYYAIAAVNASGTSIPSSEVSATPGTAAYVQLYAFDSVGFYNDGLDPGPGPLVQAPNGDFYSTTANGGSTTSAAVYNFGYGTVYRLTPSGQETVIHSFGDGSVVNDGVYPVYLTLGADGNFYGVTEYGGSAYQGTVFKMTPAGKVTILHSFGDGSVSNDGYWPVAIIQGTDGNLYGTTWYGGSTASIDPNGRGYGTAFRITPTGDMTILHSFGDGSVPNDGQIPVGGLIQAADGNFYGTCLGGPVNPLAGTVYKMTPLGQVTVLHVFGDGSVPYDGQFPFAGLIQGQDGNFYGTTSYGGAEYNGTAFKMTPSGELSILHTFHDGSVPNDGSSPESALIQGLDGDIYGTTTAGGLENGGVAFQITPLGQETILYSYPILDIYPYNPGDSLPLPLTLGLDGNVYGTANGPATVFPSAGVAYRLAIVNSAAPTGLAATARNEEVTLDWHAAMGATSYIIYRGTSAGGEGTSPIAAGIVPTTFTDADVVNGITYYYTVAAARDGFLSASSAEVSATPEPPVRPATPADVTATAGNAQAGLLWAASADATSYDLFRATSTGDEGAIAYRIDITATGYIDTGLTNGQTYFYEVAAVNSAGTSALSAEVTATPGPTAPQAPTGLIATAGNAAITLSWTQSTGASSYSVYRGTASGGESAVPLAAGLTATSYRDTGLTNGATYYYEVAAVNASGKSADSAEVSAKSTTAPPIPTNVSATPGNGRVTVTWTESAGATTYILTWDAPGWTSFRSLASTSSSSYIVTQLEDGATYSFEVAAVGAGGTSATSEPVTVTLGEIPTAPSGLKAYSGYTLVAVLWTPSAGATSYNLYRGAESGRETLYQTDIAATTFYDDQVTNGVKYYYKVAAVDALGTSAQSVEVVGAPALLPPAPPTGLTAAPSNQMVTLTWTASTGATAYDIYRATTDSALTWLNEPDVVVGTSFTDTTVSDGITYQYAVVAVGSHGNSGLSAEVSVTPVVLPPATVTAVPGDGGITVSWSSSSGAWTYNVYWLAPGWASYRLLTRTPALSYVASHLVNGTSYSFEIAAVGLVTSANSSPVTAIPIASAAHAQPMPTSIVASGGL